FSPSVLSQALYPLPTRRSSDLSRMERAVGWFVLLATLLLVFGFGYYIYHTAQRKGWFVIKAPFHTFLHSSAGQTRAAASRAGQTDRKSTRLNSSHDQISYAVFC